MAYTISWYKFERPYRLQDGDVIKVISVEPWTPNEITAGIELVGPVTWQKGLSWRDTDDVGFPGVSVSGKNAGPRYASLPNIPEILARAKMVLGKAKFLGVYCDMYAVPDLGRFVGKRITFEWRWDWGGTPPSSVYD